MFAVAVHSPGSLHRVDMAAEWDGHHQDDHKYLGFIPYSTVRDDPSLHVTQDAFHLLKNAGIRTLPERSKKESRFLARSIHQNTTRYDIDVDLGKTSPKDAADFYARQLKKPVRRSSASEESVEGVGPDGRTRLSFSFYKTSGSGAGRLWFTIPSGS
jgi:hypothetical protein